MAQILTEVDDSEWNGVLAPTSSIGYSNGDNDLARTALQTIGFSCEELLTTKLVYGTFEFMKRVVNSNKLKRLRRSLQLQILISHFQSIEANMLSENCTMKVAVLICILYISPTCDPRRTLKPIPTKLQIFFDISYVFQTIITCQIIV
ncbi:uncharacterized protein LOC108226831 [Daucus carota subsp. sativus]|uniref:uncharacterized protein LOC108226831 n=1 Tax=Daucus carota subsp. sativus TaxID=79200 RepID=UPI003083DE78